MLQRPGVSGADVAWFVAELAVYVGVSWWGATRALPLLARIALAVLVVVVMGVLWGNFAAPRAARPSRVRRVWPFAWCGSAPACLPY